MTDAPSPEHAARSPIGQGSREGLVELRSACPEFQVLALRICGKRLYEAYRVSGNGTLYSVTTEDFDELGSVLRRACVAGRDG
jgi:hypothetical protein